MLYSFIMKKIAVKDKDLKYFFAKARDLKEKVVSRFLFDNTFYSTLVFKSRFENKKRR